MRAIRPVPPWLRLVDRVLAPLMFLLGGCRPDSVQETHGWHCQPVEPGEVEESLAVVIKGDDDSPHGNRRLPFPAFHAPVLGGWRRYTVLEVQAEAPRWHVGWIHRQSPAGSHRHSHLQRLPLTGRRIRVLNQARGFETLFFAVTPDGRQLPLARAGGGVLGDRQYPGVRLF